MQSTATQMPPKPPDSPRLKLFVIEDDIEDRMKPVTTSQQRGAMPDRTGSILETRSPTTAIETERLPCWGEFPDSCLDSLKPLGRLTVRQVYEQHLLADRKKRLSPKTVVNEQTTVISRWEEFGTASPKRWFVDAFNEPDYEPLGEPVENPPIGWITKQDLERFVTAQLDDGYPIGSIPSTIASLCAWFQELRPRAAGGLGALYVVPRIKSTELPVCPKRMPEWDEIEALWQKSPMEFRAVIAFVLLLGWRCSDVQSVTFESFSEGFETCSWVVSKSRRKRPHPQHFPIHPCLRAWLTKLQKKFARGKGWREVRPFQFTRDECEFRDAWRKHLKSAGLSDRKTNHAGAEIEWLTLHALRRKCNEIYQDHHAGAGEWLLGHSISGKDSTTSSVNAHHYTRVYEPLPKVKEAILTAPIPAWLWP